MEEDINKQYLQKVIMPVEPVISKLSK